MLIGDGIYLRKLESSDLERTLKWMNSPSVAFSIGTNYPISKDEQQKWYIALSSQSEKIVFAICLETHEHVGNVSLDRIDLRHRNARFSIFIGNEDYRHCGVGRKAIQLLSSYCFSFLNLHKIYCKTSSDNSAAIEFYTKLGFKQEGVLKAHEYIQGQYVDKVLFALFNKGET